MGVLTRGHIPEFNRLGGCLHEGSVGSRHAMNESGKTRLPTKASHSKIDPLQKHIREAWTLKLPFQTTRGLGHMQKVEIFGIICCMLARTFTCEVMFYPDRIAAVWETLPCQTSAVQFSVVSYINIEQADVILGVNCKTVCLSHSEI